LIGLAGLPIEIAAVDVPVSQEAIDLVAELLLDVAEEALQAGPSPVAGLADAETAGPAAAAGD